jgi:hypothetical protein
MQLRRHRWKADAQRQLWLAGHIVVGPRHLGWHVPKDGRPWRMVVLVIVSCCCLLCAQVPRAHPVRAAGTDDFDVVCRVMIPLQFNVR